MHVCVNRTEYGKLEVRQSGKQIDYPERRQQANGCDVFSAAAYDSTVYIWYPGRGSSGWMTIRGTVNSKQLVENNYSNSSTPDLRRIH